MAPFTRERNGPERNGTFIGGVHMAMDRFAALISSSLEIKIFYARHKVFPFL